MPFCPNCGTRLDDSANFCSGCGTRINAPAAPAARPQPQYQAPAQPQYQVPVAPSAPAVDPAASAMPAPPDPAFTLIPVRYRCPNGHVFDGNDAQTVCPTCGAPLQKGGYIQIYRMGNYMGMAVGMGLYIDDIPCGHVGNKQSIRVSVPYGSHKVHMTHTTTRACNDPICTVTPQYPYVYCKARFAAGGFRIAIEPASPSEMPTK